MNTWTIIQQMMDDQEMTAKELADIAGVVPSAVTKWKKGAQIRSDALSKIAMHFSVSVDDLLKAVQPRNTANWRAASHVQKGVAYDSSDRDRLESENVELKSQLEDAREVIRNLSSALAAQGRTGVVPATPACGANSGSTVKKGRAEA